MLAKEVNEIRGDDLLIKIWHVISWWSKCQLTQEYNKVLNLQLLGLRTALMVVLQTMTEVQADNKKYKTMKFNFVADILSGWIYISIAIDTWWVMIIT